QPGCVNASGFQLIKWQMRWFWGWHLDSQPWHRAAVLSHGAARLFSLTLGCGALGAIAPRPALAAKHSIAVRLELMTELSALGRDLPLVERRFVVLASGTSLRATPTLAPFATAGIAYAL